MSRAITYSFRDMERILRKNGYHYVRANGGHMIYSNGIGCATVPINLKKFTALGIIKQHDLLV